MPLRHGRQELEDRAAWLEAQYADETAPVRTLHGRRSGHPAAATAARLQQRSKPLVCEPAHPSPSPPYSSSSSFTFSPRPQVPRPPHWGGFLLRPLSIEFWQGRPSRLHDRLRYVRQSAGSQEWRLERLAP